jgi:hypothetical protein
MSVKSWLGLRHVEFLRCRPAGIFYHRPACLLPFSLDTYSWHELQELTASNLKLVVVMTMQQPADLLRVHGDVTMILAEYMLPGGGPPGRWPHAPRDKVRAPA